MLCDYGCGQEAKYQFKNGKWCCSKNVSQCSEIKNKIRTSFEEIIKFVESEGYEILSKKEDYKDQFSYLWFRCPEGHEFPATWVNFKNGSRCPKCANNKKGKILSKKLRTPFKKIIKFVENEDYVLLSRKEDYINCQSKLWFRCPRGHEYPARWNDFKNGSRCPVCFKERQRGIVKSEEARKKMRIWKINDIKSKHGQVSPAYNPRACKRIIEYGEEHGYHFQHAENGGEYHIKELGYWVDGYDKEKNVVIEIDEKAHFNKNGNLKEKDVLRQKEITDFLGCKFIRLRI